MTYAREKRLLLGLAALLAPLPLPFNQMLEWTVLALFEAGVVAFLLRAARGAEGPDHPGRWLSNRALNLLGLAYLPVLVVDIAASGRIQMLRPVLHLALFGVLAKLWSLREEKQKWQTWMGIFFLFLGAMATSVHPSVVLYLVVFVSLTVVLMVRFVYLHVLTSFGHRDIEPPRLPVRAFLVGAVAATLLAAVPLFALLPRVRAPYIMAPGGGGGQMEARAGFSDAMSLDLIGRIRDNRQIAMRLTFSGKSAPPGAMRFKAATYDIWQGRTWRRSANSRTLRRSPREGRFRLAEGERTAAVEIALEPLRSTSLIIPMETLAIDLDLAVLDLDRGGALFLKGMPSEVLDYKVAMGSSEASLADPPVDAESGPMSPGDSARPEASDPALDMSGVTPPIAALAAQWAGAGTPSERARRIERHLLFEYDYTLEFIGRGGERPIEFFLLEARRGHCEYFASAMVLLLRAQGIPARLITGFYGAEYAPWERAWVVRQSNAHAWVEGYLPGLGWQVFDPTPPSGRPTSEAAGLLGSVRSAWEFVVFRWDRYVISFDFYDQVGIFYRLHNAWDRFVKELFQSTRGPRRPAAPAASPEGPAIPPRPAVEEAPAFWSALRTGFVGGAVLVAIAGALFILRRREAWTATRAYLALRATLAGGGLGLQPWLGPLGVAAFVERRLPGAAPATARLVTSYLRESFAGESLAAEALTRLRDDLATVDRASRAAIAARRREKRTGRPA
jgi:transglutaminase-like putative cysteine protease